jgi:hypothetical protein
MYQRFLLDIFVLLIARQSNYFQPVHFSSLPVYFPAFSSPPYLKELASRVLRAQIPLKFHMLYLKFLFYSPIAPVISFSFPSEPLRTIIF